MEQEDDMTDVDGATSAALDILEAQFPPGTRIVVIIQPHDDPECTRLAHNSNDDQVAALLRALGSLTASDRKSRPTSMTLQ